MSSAHDYLRFDMVVSIGITDSLLISDISYADKEDNYDDKDVLLYSR